MGYQSVRYGKCYTCRKKIDLLKTHCNLCDKCYSQIKRIEQMKNEIRKEQDKTLTVGMIFKKYLPEKEGEENQEYILIAFKNGLYVLVKEIGDIDFKYELYPDFYVDYEAINKKVSFNVIESNIERRSGE